MFTTNLTKGVELVQNVPNENVGDNNVRTVSNSDLEDYVTSYYIHLYIYVYDRICIIYIVLRIQTHSDSRVYPHRSFYLSTFCSYLFFAQSQVACQSASACFAWSQRALGWLQSAKHWKWEAWGVGDLGYLGDKGYACGNTLYTIRAKSRLYIDIFHLSRPISFIRKFLEVEELSVR